MKNHSSLLYSVQCTVYNILFPEYFIYWYVVPIYASFGSFVSSHKRSAVERNIRQGGLSNPGNNRNNGDDRRLIFRAKSVLLRNTRSAISQQCECVSVQCTPNKTHDPQLIVFRTDKYERDSIMRPCAAKGQR